MRDDSEIAANGTIALNITGTYFSEYEIDGKPHYEDWCYRELAERVQRKREFTIKSHKPFFNSRVGAKVKINLKNEQLIGVINALSFRYKRDRAFITTIRLKEV